MRKKVVSFPVKECPEKPVPEWRSRLVLSIGSWRYSFDLCSTVTELKQKPAEIIPLSRAAAR
jgi:hypothetical protein